MIRIQIYKEVTNTNELVDLLNDVATRVKDGALEGGREWEIIGEPEPVIES